MSLLRDPASWRAQLVELPALLAPYTQWLVSGSCALAHHGMPISPNDIDLWFEPAELDRFAHAQGLVVEERVHAKYRTEGFTLCRADWEVDCVGRVTLDSGLILQVDREMLNAAAGCPLIESCTDLISELLAMNRPPPKADWDRAKMLAQSSSRLNFEVIRARLHIFGMSPSHINAVLSFLQK